MYIDMGMRDAIMADRHSIAEACRNLPTLVRTVQSVTAIELTRHGEPAAVLIGRKAFEWPTEGYRFTEAYEAFENNTDLTTLAINPDEVFGTVQDADAASRHRVVSRGTPARHQCRLGTVTSATRPRHHTRVAGA